MSETKNARERLFDALAAGVRGHALSPYLDEVEFAAIRLATPPTPDLDAVREALKAVVGQAHSPEYRALLDALGIRGIAAPEFVADTLLAAVSRPAEARGEPSEAMVEAAVAKAWAATDLRFDAPSTADDDKTWKQIFTEEMRAALAAQREQTP